MKTIYDVIGSLDTTENYLVLIRNALVCQDPVKGGFVGPEAWDDIFSDLCDRLQSCMEALKNIEGGRDA